MKTLGERLRYLREKRGWSQTLVCKKLGISNSTLSGYERDYREPDTDTLSRLAGLYGVTTDYLLGRSKDKQLKIEDDKRITEETLYYLDILESLPEEERIIFEKKINDYADYLRSKQK